MEVTDCSYEGGWLSGSGSGVSIVVVVFVVVVVVLWCCAGEYMNALFFSFRPGRRGRV